MRSLEPFLISNPSLKCCIIGLSGINILSNTLSNRSEYALKRMNTTMTWGCTSLANLLGNEESNLTCWYLDLNSIDNDCVVILTNSLAHNTKLRELYLFGNNAITNEGWSALLKLVCNSSSVKDVMESNHTLEDVGCVSGYLSTKLKCVSLQQSL
jgi:hypothetical protein